MSEEASKPRELTFDWLKEIGAFVPEKPILREIEWGGETLQIYVKVLGAGHKDQLLAYGAEFDETEERSASALILSKTVFFDPEGQHPIKFTDAYRLVGPLSAKFLEAVASLNGSANNGQ